MQFETLGLKTEGHILTVTLSNPPINLINGQMIQELFQLIGYLHQTPDVRVVIFESADEDFFLAHMDLEAVIASESDPSQMSKYPDINGLQSLGLAWQNVPAVKIVKIDGRCRGGGVELALAMDMRFASRRSLFCLPEVSAGFPPAGGGTTRLFLNAGPGRALEFLLSGRDFSAEEAERYGLVNRCLDDDALDAYVDDLARRVALRSPSVVAQVRNVGAKVAAPFVEPLFAAYAAENDAVRACFASEEMREMMRLHLEVGQTRERELDLPGTMAGLIAKRQG